MTAAPTTEIRIAESDDELRACHPLVVQLRTHLTDVDAFVAQVRRQQAAGYRAAYARRDGRVLGYAGFRTGEALAWGRFVYVDDLVTDGAARSTGVGQALIAWLREHGRAEGCQSLHLDSGVERFAAHRFYLRERFEISSHHFSQPLGEGD